MKIRSIALFTGAAVIGLVATASAVSLAFLPDSVQVSRSAVVNASPEQVFAQLNSTAGFHRMNPFLDAYTDVKITRSGPEQGVGAVYAWDGGGSQGSQTIVRVEPNKRIEMQLDLGVQGRPLQTFVIEPAAGGSKVSWIMDAKFGFNPIGRIIGQTLDGNLGPIYLQGLAKLNTSLSSASNATPLAINN
jgi:uncharacterized protein YndB with AHSA1/START domain